MRADIKIGVEEEKVMAEQLNNSSLAAIQAPIQHCRDSMIMAIFV